MKIVKPSVEIYYHAVVRDGQVIKPAPFLEGVGRTCYKSEERITEDSAQKFIKMLDERGHGAMLEHGVISVKFICDRGVSHEMVRHRLASFAQESTRYCNYSKNKFDGEISVIQPCDMPDEEVDDWKDACLYAEAKYMKLLEKGAPPQRARSVLPTCTKTELWVTANYREWQHIIKLRNNPKAHPQMVELMAQVYENFHKEIPELF